MVLSNNTVLITGGGSGIGLALAERFSAAGSTVLICGRRQEALEEAKAKVPSLATFRCDVAMPKEREALFEWATASYPQLNVLVNNAGIQNRLPPLIEAQKWAPYEQEIATNLEAPIHLTMLFAAHLAKQPKAALINITSGLAFVPIAAMPSYCATKAAMHSFTLSTRHQLRNTSVQVIEVAPPAVNTGLGGKGLHDFGVPLDEFSDHVMRQLAAGDDEIGYQFSEQGLRGSRSATAEIFARMNP